jgi:hypothetical protein
MAVEAVFVPVEVRPHLGPEWMEVMRAALGWRFQVERTDREDVMRGDVTV